MFISPQNRCVDFSVHMLYNDYETFHILRKRKWLDEAMATMKDVAKEAGLSLGTVSNVINNLSTVTEENRMKVMEAIKKLKYRPNIAARTLKTNTSKSIGLIIPDITNPFYPELARGVEDAAREFGYTVFLCNNDRDAIKERQYSDAFVEKNVDGIILVKSSLTYSVLNEIAEKCKIVLIDYSGENPQFDSIDVDDYKGAIQAMTFLHQNSHQRIAFIGGVPDSKSSKSRMQAYVNFLNEKKLKIDDLLIKEGRFDWQSGYNAALELLNLPIPPTAIFAANDLMAIGAIKAIRERHLQVPYDISVIGYDDIGMAALCTPELTTIRQPKYEMGTLSVEMLIKRVENAIVEETVKIIKKVMDTTLIVRESVGSTEK